MIKIRQASVPGDLVHIEKSVREYLDWVSDQLHDFKIETADVDAMMTRTMQQLDQYLPPEGALLLAYQHNVPAGIIFLKKIRADICEIKRMYVAPEFRGCGIGHALLDRIFEEARSAGYARIFLDSVSFMRHAQALYRSRGFVEIDQYPESEMRDVLRNHLTFMGLELN
ncbi:MAG: GNAT family N-acetyltransferase [Gammaproteobacteria bacterium]